ncbi:DNA repair protein complementing XP-C cells homolog [Drosophila innubila]|uniref:DNA repair protein complementing XP-C cells homolog n=1 Tax=Drosophila innubila TaxID=198719 RepID=UPI00148D194A|nr:DNA repair protein complementing XP-C cells homolog [Drosophila innubila]
MSDEEEESLSEGFSASEEDEWTPGKDARGGGGGESSDDDDSEFEELPGGVGGAATALPGATAAGNSGRSNKRREQKSPSGIKGAAVKKRKPSGQSLRSKLYNKYRPPPKTFPTSPQQNSPTASGSNRRTASKNAKTPNESNNCDSSSESSVEDYLVNPADLDLRSSFFTATNKEKSPAPQFDCNAGIDPGNLSDSDNGSGSEDNNDSSMEDADKAFDFRDLLENANSLERTRAALLNKQTRTMETETPSPGGGRIKDAAMDVNALLALGENQNEKQEERTKDRRLKEPPSLDAPSRLSKTKSTRIKRHTKTRPASTVLAAGADTDDSEFEEVADDNADEDTTPNVSGDLEIHVGIPSRHPTKEEKTQLELENALKRRMNRDIKDRQLLMHKVSLLCCIARSIKYNRILGDSALMQESLKLLPSKNAYPTERGVELKYLQSFITWFKVAVKLQSPDLYPTKSASSKRGIIEDILQQMKRKEARCKQDMIFIFIALARSMGMNCRLIVNLQPMALKPQTCDLIPIKLKPTEKNKSQKKQTEEDEDPDEDEDQSDNKHSKSKKAKSSKESSKTTTVGKSSKEVAKIADSSRSKTTNKADSDLKKTVGKGIASSSRGSSRSKAAQEHKSKDSPGMSSSTGNSSTSKKQKEASLEIDDKPSTSRSSRQATESTKIKAKPQLSILKRGSHNTSDKEDDKKKLKLSLQIEESPIARRTRKASADAEKKTSGSAFVSKYPASKIGESPIARRTRKASADSELNASGSAYVSEYPASKIGSPVIPKLVLPSSKMKNAKHSDAENANPSQSRDTRSRSKSPKVHISTLFLKGQHNGNHDNNLAQDFGGSNKSRRNICDAKAKISPTFLNKAEPVQLRTRQQKANALSIPQLDGGDDNLTIPKKRPKLEKLQKANNSQSTVDTDNSTPTKQTPIKKAPVLPKVVQHLRNDRKDRRVLSTDDESVKEKRKTTASDIWIEVWSDAEEQWICIDLFKGKLHCVDTIRRNASSNMAYVFAFQDDLSVKDVTARYCSSWSTTVRKARVEKSWLDNTLAPYLGHRTKRDIREDEQMRRIHSDKPLPKSISEFKDHPLYALERHLLKFQGIYPADAPTLGFIRGEAIYSRDCVHLLHSRDIWLKSARVVKLGEQPYKIVKARPKWDKLTRTVIKDQPLEIFGYWQTQDYEPPTAENGIVPRNAYGNVELFKECMLPKKTVHLRLPGLMRVCKKLNIDCANAVIGFDFHQGACHPMYDGFVVCEEFGEIVTAAWEEDQQEQARKEREKYESRVYGNWKKLIKGLLIRERLKRKYNF